MTMRKVVIIGAGGFGREVESWVRLCSEEKFEILGYLDNDYKNLPKQIGNTPVLGDDSWLNDQNERIGAFIGVGHPKIKRKIHLNLKDKCYFPNLIATDAIMGLRVDITPDSGIIITPNNVLTCDIKVESFCMINLSCTIGHDCTLGAYSTLSPGVNVSGYTEVGTGAYLGTGSTILEHTKIGDWSVVGGQSMVLKDVEENSINVGVPSIQKRVQPKDWYK